MIAAGYAVVGGIQWGGRVATWAIAVGTVVVTAVLFRVLRERVYSLIERLSDAARTDPLTGVLNRRGFAALLELEMSRSDRTGRDVVLVLGDLDGFKALNDSLGHAAGDRMLSEVARTLATSARRIDVVARVGGDEFAIVAADTELRNASQLAARVIRMVEQTSKREGWPLSISLGLARYPRDGTTIDDLLRAADQSLYRAKRERSGRVASLGAPPVRG